MRVVVIDRQPAFAWGLAAMLETRHDAQPVAVCLSAHHAFHVVREQHPDIVTLSLRLPETDPAELCRQLRKAHPPVRAALFLEAGDGDLVGRCLRVIPGVAILRDASVAEIRGALLRLRHNQPDPPPPSVDDDALTARERQILELVGHGLTSREVATIVSLAPNTIRSYCQSTLAKLGARNRMHALELARARGLISSEARRRLPREPALAGVPRRGTGLGSVPSATSPSGRSAP